MFPTLASLSLWKLPIFLGLWTQGSGLCPWGHLIFCSVYVCVSLLCLPLIKWKRKSFSCVWLFVTPRNSPGQNTGVGSLSLLQGIFPTQGSKPGLPYCRQILYLLSRKGKPLVRLHMIVFRAHYDNLFSLKNLMLNNNYKIFFSI